MPRVDPDGVDGRLAREIASLLDSGREMGRPDFAERLVRALRGGLVRLDALPRDDVFWNAHANDRATSYKLSAFAEQRSASDPADVEARWIKVALAVAYGANDGGLPLLAPLIAADVRGVVDAILVAGFIWDCIGLEPTSDLVTALSAVGLSDLEEAADDPGEVGEAARVALRVLEGTPFSRARIGT